MYILVIDAKRKLYYNLFIYIITIVKGNIMELLYITVALIFILVAFVSTKLRTRLMEYSDSFEFAEQGKRCFVHDFSRESQVGEASFPTTNGCKVEDTDKGIKLTAQSRLCLSSLV